MIKKKTLDNGLRIVYEKIPYVKSVSIGVWAGVGSRLETHMDNGISHFAEHMLFKGTKQRSAQNIAQEVDYIGGHLNAFTSRECTCYYAKVIDRYIETSFDILSDMYLHSLLNPKDIELERGVILEEISMYEDSPEDISLDLLAKAAWGNDSLGFVVSGTSESIESINKEKLQSFCARYYTAPNTVVSVVGNFDEGEICGLVEKYFGKMNSEGRSYADYKGVAFCGDKLVREKEIEQTHIAFGFEGACSNSREIYAEAVLSNVFGGGMSSRLFQKIREERGLAYSVYTAPEAYSHAGLFYIYAGLSHENSGLVREIMLEEIEKLKNLGVTDYELEKGVRQLRGSYIMGLESVSGRMNAIGRREVLGEEQKTPEQIIAEIDNVNMYAISGAIDRIFGGRMSESVVTCKD